MMRRRLAAYAAAGMMVLMAGMASADVIGNCTLTGYTFMGGGMAYESTAASPVKDYFLAQPLEEPGQGYWGYGWAKFDVLSTETVDKAYLVIDLLGVGSMSFTDASPTNPTDLAVYAAGATDVAGLGTDADARTTLQAALTSATAEVSVVLTANGEHALDITDLYNGWVTGTIENHGVVFASNSGAKYASFGSSEGSLPTLSTVPEPTTMLLLAGSAIGLVRARRRRNA